MELCMRKNLYTAVERGYFIKLKMMNRLLEFIQIVKYCIKISYRASLFYTIFRIFNRGASAVLTILSTYLASTLIDELAFGEKGSMPMVFILFVFILMVRVGSRVLLKMNQYCTTMHETLLANYLNMHTMEKAAKVDIEYYDSPVFYNTIEAVRRDINSVSRILWNLMDGGGAILTFIGSLFVVSHKYFLFVPIIILTAVPAAIIGRQYTKFIYNWDLGHIDDQRKMGRYINRNKAEGEMNNGN